MRLSKAKATQSKGKSKPTDLSRKEFYEKQLQEVVEDIAQAKQLNSMSALANLRIRAQSLRDAYDEILEAERQQQKESLDLVPDAELMERCQQMLQTLPDSITEQLFLVLKERFNEE